MKLAANGTIVNPVLDQVDNLAHGQTHGDAGGGQIKEAQRSFAESGRVPGHQQANAELQRQQSAGIVQQALAFQHVHQPPRQSQAAGDGGGGDGVGRRDNGAQHQPDPPIEARQQPLPRFGDPDNGESHQAKGQENNADQVEGELPPGSEPRRAVKQRRQNDEKHQVGIEANFRNPGKEAQQKTGNHQDDRIGDRQLPRQQPEHHHEQQQQQKYDFDVLNTMSRHAHPTVPNYSSELPEESRSRCR